MIICFEAETISHNISPVMEFFEFDVWTLGTLLNEYCDMWAEEKLDIIKDTAHWWKVEVTNGNEIFV